MLERFRTSGRLPPLHVLAAEYGVSSWTVEREAVALIASHRLPIAALEDPAAQERIGPRLESEIATNWVEGQEERLKPLMLGRLAQTPPVPLDYTQLRIALLKRAREKE